MTKILCFLCCLAFFCGCKDKDTSQEVIQQDLVQVELPADFETMLFDFQKGNLPETCQTNNDLICAIEKTVKCALEPTQTYCDKNKMPDFLFFDDAMFSQDDVEGRPTKQSFKLLKTKPLDHSTLEVYTQGDCDSNWFGACRGNIIYVMDNSSGQWIVKEIYAVETIR